MSSHVRLWVYSQFNDFVDEVYNIEEGQVFRKRDKLERAFTRGFGYRFAPALSGLLSMQSQK